MTDEENIIAVSVHDNPERFPYSMVRGSLANLSALRRTDAATRATFLEERNTNPTALEADAPAVFCEIEARLLTSTQNSQEEEEEEEEEIFGDAGDENHNNGENDDEQEPISTTPASPPISGTVFVTNTQILFVTSEADNMLADTAVGGACILLHALSDDPEPSLYLQLQSGDDDAMMEMTIFASQENCQELFEALCKLINLHPIEGDDANDTGGMMGMLGGGMIGGGFGDNVFADYGEPSGEWITADTSTTATKEERGAMLERLDNLLVVAPGLEVQEGNGQFDDAPEC